MNVISISGSHGDTISDTLNYAGVPCEFTPNPDYVDKVVYITYPWELYEYVMTRHWLDVVYKPYYIGNTQPFTDWIPRCSVIEKVSEPKNVTYQDWALHVLDAYKHIGTGDPLNGVLSSLKSRVENVKDFVEIPLELLITDTSEVCKTLEKFTEKTFTQKVYDFLKDRMQQSHVEMQPYMEAIHELKGKIEVDKLNIHQYNYINNLGYPGIHPTV